MCLFLQVFIQRGEKAERPRREEGVIRGRKLSVEFGISDNDSAPTFVPSIPERPSLFAHHFFFHYY